MLLQRERIQTLHANAISAGIERSALLSGIDKRYTASLPLSRSRSEQLLSDLSRMNEIEQLADGSVPLVTWLQNAILLAGPRMEGLKFEEVLKELKPAAHPRPSPAAASTESHRPDAQDAWNDNVVRVFLSTSGSTVDQRFTDGLVTSLAPLRRLRKLALWHRGLASAGDDVERLARQRLGESDIVLLLVSPDYFADDTTFEEMNAALNRRVGGTQIIPILARPASIDSTPLGKLKALPSTGRPISQTDADSAYTNIADSLSATVEDLLARKRLQDQQSSSTPDDEDDPLRGSRGLSPLSSVVKLEPGTPMTSVFQRTGEPTHTYVEPEQFRKIRNAMRILGRGLVIEGPTQIGKSTAVRHALESIGAAKTARFLDCHDEAQRNEARSITTATKLDGHVVIDNTHVLPAADLADLARFMRALADKPSPTVKITLIGFQGTARRLIANQRDLAGRTDIFAMDRQPDDKIREFLTMAERTAALRFLHKESIVREVRGSFRLAQEICFASVEAQDIDKVPSRRKDVDVDPAGVAESVREALEKEFGDLLVRLAMADRNTPTPGACLTLLSALADGDSGSVPLGRTRSKHAHLSPAFDWIESGELAKFLEAQPEIGSLVQIGPGTFSSGDPRVLYYLRGMDWTELGAQVGIEVTNVDGELRVVQNRPDSPKLAVTAPVPEAPSPATPSTTTTHDSALKSIVDVVPFPWFHASSQKLLTYLTQAYPEVRMSRFLAQKAAIRLGLWTMDGGIDNAWRSLIELASAQAKLRALIDVVLADQDVQAYHDNILECIAPVPGLQ